MLGEAAESLTIALSVPKFSITATNAAVENANRFVSSSIVVQAIVLSFLSSCDGIVSEAFPLVANHWANLVKHRKVYWIA